MKAEHRAGGASVSGARGKICVQSKPEYSTRLLFNYIQLRSPLLVERHQSDMHMHARARTARTKDEKKKENPCQAFTMQLLID